MTTRKLKTQFDELTAREKRIVISYSKGLRSLACAEDAGLKYKNANTAHANVNRVMAHPAAREYVEDIFARAVKAADEGAVMSIVEKREFLARIKRAAINSTDDDSDLWQEWRETETEHSTSITKKLPDKLRAITLDNELAGHNQPQKLEHSANNELAQILADLAGFCADS